MAVEGYLPEAYPWEYAVAPAVGVAWYCCCAYDVAEGGATVDVALYPD